jgi:hypothetical protein
MIATKDNLVEIFQMAKKTGFTRLRADSLDLQSIALASELDDEVKAEELELQAIVLDGYDNAESKEEQEFTASDDEYEAQEAEALARNDVDTQLFLIGDEYFKFQSYLDDLQKLIDAEFIPTKKFLNRLNNFDIFYFVTVSIFIGFYLYKLMLDSERKFSGDGFEDLQADLDVCPGPAFCENDLENLLIYAQKITGEFMQCTVEMMTVLCQRNAEIVASRESRTSRSLEAQTVILGLFASILAVGAVDLGACTARRFFESKLGKILSDDELLKLQQHFEYRLDAGITFSEFVEGEYLKDIRLNHRIKTDNLFLSTIKKRTLNKSTQTGNSTSLSVSELTDVNDEEKAYIHDDASEMYLILDKFFVLQIDLDSTEKLINEHIERRNDAFKKIAKVIIASEAILFVAVMGIDLAFSQKFTGSNYDDLQAEIAACPDNGICYGNTNNLLYFLKLAEHKFSECTNEMMKALCDRHDQIIANQDSNYSLSRIVKKVNFGLYATQMLLFSVVAPIAVGIRYYHKATLGAIFSADQILEFDGFSASQEKTVTPNTSVYYAAKSLTSIRENHQSKTEQVFRNARRRMLALVPSTQKAATQTNESQLPKVNRHMMLASRPVEAKTASPEHKRSYRG